jgi:hypothetical protein
MAKSELPLAPNASSGVNMSDEYLKFIELATTYPRSTTGNLSWTSTTSNVVYATIGTVYDGMGQQGQYLLLKDAMKDYMLFASEVWTIDTGNTLPTTGWVASGSDYDYEYDFADTSITENDIVGIFIDKDSIVDAVTCGLAPANDSYDGGVILYASGAPSVAIVFDYIVWRII